MEIPTEDQFTKVQLSTKIRQLLYFIMHKSLPFKTVMNISFGITIWSTIMTEESSKSYTTLEAFCSPRAAGDLLLLQIKRIEWIARLRNRWTDEWTDEWRGRDHSQTPFQHDILFQQKMFLFYSNIQFESLKTLVISKYFYQIKVFHLHVPYP